MGWHWQREPDRQEEAPFESSSDALLGFVWVFSHIHLIRWPSGLWQLLPNLVDLSPLVR